MIYMEPQQLGIDPLFQSWLKSKLPEVCNNEQKHIIQVSAMNVKQYFSFREWRWHRKQGSLIN